MKVRAGIFLLLWLLLLPAGFARAQAVDMFPGTLAVYQGRPVLIRCDLVKNAYVLMDVAGKSDAYLKLIGELGAGLQKPVEARVFASYRSVDGLNVLVVDRIENITPNSSCHLFPPAEPLNIKAAGQ